MADPDTHIEPLLDKVDDPVQEKHSRRHLRIGLQISADRRPHMQSAKQDRRGQSEQPLRFRILTGETPFGLLQIAQNPAGCLQIGPALLRQRKLAGRPRHEPDVEILFKHFQMPADRGERHREPPAGAGQRARIRNGHKHANRVELIHHSSKFR